MVFAYASAIIIVDNYLHNNTSLSQVNTALCLTDIVISVQLLLISFFYYLPFKYLWLNVYNTISIIYSMVYCSIIINTFIIGSVVSDDIYNMSIIIIIFNSFNILFSLTMDYCKIYTIWSIKFGNHDTRDTEADYYSIKDLCCDV